MFQLSRIIVLGTAALLTVAPASGRGQSARSADPLVVPTHAGARCATASTPPAFRTAASGLRSVEVVVAADEPSRRRTLTLVVDARATPVELHAVSFGPMLEGGVGEEIVWARDAGGAVQSFRLRHTQASAKEVRHARLALSVADQQRVQRLLAWMGQQCASLIHAE